MKASQPVRKIIYADKVDMHQCCSVSPGTNGNAVAVNS